MPALVTLLHEPALLHLWADSDMWVWSVRGLKSHDCQSSKGLLV